MAAATPSTSTTTEEDDEARGGTHASGEDEDEWMSAVHIFDTSRVPPREGPSRQGITASGHPTGARRPAQAVPVNGAQPVPIENDLFVGKVLTCGRPTHSLEAEKGDYPYKWYFGPKSRQWELRFQGRFKRVPEGELFGGLEMYDFEHCPRPSFGTRLVAKFSLPLIERAVGQRMYFSWGDRDPADPDPESLCVVCGWAGWDQVIVTPPGEEPPPLTSDLAEHGMRRNNMPSAQYKQKVAAICASLDTETTYTFCFWGPSRFVDIAAWRLNGMIPRRIPLTSCLGDWPAHMVLYELDAKGGGPTGKHVESRKHYLLDLLIWSDGGGNGAALDANIRSRYDLMRPLPGTMHAAADGRSGPAEGRLAAPKRQGPEA